MKARDILLPLGALLLGVAIAFPLGLMLRPSHPDAAPQAARSATMRQVYSPRVLSDPYFLDQQRQGIEVLERHCRERRQYCAEAAGGRAWLDAQKAR